MANLINAVINSIAQPVTLFGSSNPASLGDATLGDNLLGDEVVSQTAGIAKFRCINSLPDVNCFEYQPIIYSDTADARWEILALGTDADDSNLQSANFIINKLPIT
jgi:hypothetical protein